MSVREEDCNTLDTSELLFWQLLDSAFPSGGFAHSGGIEAAWQYGRVKSAEAVGDFTQNALWQSVYGAIPFVIATFEEGEKFQEVDQHCDAFLSNAIANRASRNQGQTLLASAQRIFVLQSLAELRTKARLGKWPLHWAPVIGMVGVGLDIPRIQLIRLSLFMTARGILTSAVRLGIIGPMQAQGIQVGLIPKMEEMVERTSTLTLEDVAQTSPLQEVLHGGHDRLYSRLFLS